MWFSDYIVTSVLGVCSAVLISVDFWVLMLSSQGLIDSSNCTTAPLNTFFTGAFVSLIFCMLGMLLLVYESKRNTQSYLIHSFVALIWANALIWSILGAVWTNQSYYGTYCNSINSYKTMVVLFTNTVFMFVVQVFITTLALLGIGAVFENTDPITVTPMTNTRVNANGNTVVANGVVVNGVVANSSGYSNRNSLGPVGLHTRTVGMDAVVVERNETGINDIVNTNTTHTNTTNP